MRGADRVRQGQKEGGGGQDAGRWGEPGRRRMGGPGSAGAKGETVEKVKGK